MHGSFLLKKVFVNLGVEDILHLNHRSGSIGGLEGPVAPADGYQ